MTFDDLKFGPHLNGWKDGVQALAFFENGYGASVIRGEYSYGGREGLYELAVIKGTPGEWDLCYDTDITEDVVGHLSEEAVSVLLECIENLA